MAEPIIVTPNNIPDPTGCLPGTKQELANFVADAVSVTLQNNIYSLINYGSTVPSADSRNRPWFRLTADGVPLGTYYFYNGRWRRVVGIPPYSIVPFFGNLRDYDGTGAGIVGTQGEAFYWCNGQNGTPDLRNVFLAGANQLKNGTDWLTDIDPENLNVTDGGVAQVKLVKSQLPELNVVLPIGLAGGGSDRFPFGNTSYDSDNPTFTKTIGGTGNGDDGQAAFHTNIPPFVAACYLQYNPYLNP